MAIVTRYFSTSAAGAGDGTSWADRAALFSGGNWSSVITGFDFSGIDSLSCAIEGGLTYSCGQALASGLFSSAPNVGNPLIMHGCDGSGVLLTPDDPDWVSAMPAWDDSGLPVIASTTNINTITLNNTMCRFVKFTASGANTSTIQNGAFLDWCVVINSSSGTSAGAVLQFDRITNSVLSATASSYSHVLSAATGGIYCNTRIVGVAGSSGNRNGILSTGFSGADFERVTVVGNGGRGISSSGSSQRHRIRHSVFANNGSDGIQMPITASPTNWNLIQACMITGNGGYGVNRQSVARILLSGNRMRDNTSGNVESLGNHPEYDSYTTDSDDATEYVDAAGGDFRIKAGSAIHGQGYGVADEASGGGSTVIVIEEG